MIRIGVDEAGLGPTLGPLVAAGMAVESDDADLWRALGSAIGPPRAAEPKIEVGDSKQIHQGTRKLARIERTVLSTLAWTHGLIPSTVRELLDLACTPLAPLAELAPWWGDLDEALPVAADPGAIEASASLLLQTAKRAGIHALAYEAELIPAATINAELHAELQRVRGTKNTWATDVVVRRLVAMLAFADRASDAQAVHACCDKAGGRRDYRAPLERRFDALVTPLQTWRECSSYRIRRRDKPIVELAFRMKADGDDPRVAWASCLCKYLRELSMRAFNRWWAARVPELRATAGYPQDAKRFLSDVEAAVGELPHDRWIRSR